MKFQTKDMKKMTVILKRIVTDKKKGTIRMKSNGDGHLHVSGANKFIEFYGQMECESTESFAFDISLPLFDKWLTDNEKKKANKLLTFDAKVLKKSMKENQTNATFKIEPIEWDEQEASTLLFEAEQLPPKSLYVQEDYQFIPPSPWGFVQDEEAFLRVLKEGHETIKKNTDIRTMFLALRSGKAMATEERRTHLYRLSEQFPFETIYLHRDVLAAIASTFKKGEIKHKKTTNGFYLQYGEYLYRIDDRQKTVFPNLRKMNVKRKPFSFTVDAASINAVLKGYKAEVTNLVCRFDEQGLHIVPLHENYESSVVPLLHLEGKPIECKFSVDVFKGFIGSFDENVHIDHVEFTNLKQKEGYLWRVYTPHQMNVAAGISRLDWDMLARLHKEGALKNVSSLHELEGRG